MSPDNLDASEATYPYASKSYHQLVDQVDRVFKYPFRSIFAERTTLEREIAEKARTVIDNYAQNGEDGCKSTPRVSLLLEDGRFSSHRLMEQNKPDGTKILLLQILNQGNPEEIPAFAIDPNGSVKTESGKELDIQQLRAARQVLTELKGFLDTGRYHKPIISLATTDAGEMIYPEGPKPPDEY